MEDFKQPLQFDISLKQLSMNALLIQIYEQSDIKEKLKGVIHDKDQGVPYAFPSTIKKKELIKTVSKKIKALGLPESLISEMEGISIFFANKISIWSDYVIRMLELDISYLDKIYFTNYGTVDDGKIFESYWQNHKSFSKILKTRRRENSNAFTSRMACQFASVFNSIVLICFFFFIRRRMTFLNV